MRLAALPSKIEIDKLLFATDIAATLLFAIEGALAAVNADLDLLGIMVLAFATALGGGIMRDLLIGDTPPSSLRDWRYPITAFAGATIVFFLHKFVAEIPMWPLIITDAAGLALFAMSGTEKALLFNMHPVIAVLLGTITGVGGGTIRDIFLARVPSVLDKEVYATAALVGAACMILGKKLRLSQTHAAILGALVCFLLRIISAWRHWNLPHAFPH